MTSERILDNARIILADTVIHGHLLIRNGRIMAIDEGRSRQPGADDMEGDYLTPGLVEIHSDNVERHLIPRPGVIWPTMPAILAHDATIAGAGITTVLDAIACGSDYGKSWRREICEITVAGIDQARRDGHLRADHLLHLRCEIVAPDMPTTFGKTIDNPYVRLVSIMDHTPGARQFVDIDKFRVYYKGKHGLSEAELDTMIAERRAMREEHGPGNRTYVIAETRRRGITLASHDDATVEHVTEAVEDGVRVAEFPTTVAAAEAARRQGLTTVMGAPNLVRGGSHSGNVAAGELARRGLLDCLSSDYVPTSLMQAAWQLHDEDIMTLPEAFGVVSGQPAAVLGLTDRGTLEAGKRADIVRVHRSSVPVIREVLSEGRRIA